MDNHVSQSGLSSQVSISSSWLRSDIDIRFSPKKSDLFSNSDFEKLVNMPRKFGLNKI